MDNPMTPGEAGPLAIALSRTGLGRPGEIRALETIASAKPSYLVRYERYEPKARWVTVDQPARDAAAAEGMVRSFSRGRGLRNIRVATLYTYESEEAVDG